MGQKRFKSLRKSFKEFSKGNNPPDREYTFRVAPNKIISALLFLQSALQVRPGAIRSVSLAGHTFQGMPVYTRGGTSVETLYQTYSNSVDAIDRLGITTFIDFSKLLTARGVEKTGLSTYYVRLKYASSIYIGMIERIKQIKELTVLPGMLPPTNFEVNEWLVDNDCDLLLLQWKNILQFLSYQYSEKNLKIDSETPCLCCRYGVSKINLCNHEHIADNNCKNTIDALEAIVPFTKLLQHLDISSRLEVEDEVKYEIKTMERTTSIISEQIKNYMGHRMRAKVQFAAIIQVYKELTVNNALVVFDHKQKVLPRQHREGQASGLLWEERYEFDWSDDS